MITGTGISGYYPVNSPNISSFNNLTADSIIKAMVLKIFDESIILRLYDGSMLRAKAISFNGINIEESLDLILNMINNSQITDDSNAIDNSRAISNPREAYADTTFQKGKFINIKGIILQEGNFQPRNSFCESGGVSSYSIKYISPKDVFKAGEVIELKVIKKDSNLILMKNINVNSKENLMVEELSANAEQVEEKYRSFVSKTVDEKNDIRSVPKTNTMKNEIYGNENRISGADVEEQYIIDKINKIFMHSKTHENDNNKIWENFETNNNELGNKDSLHKEFLTEIPLNSEVPNEETLKEIIRALDSLKKADILRILRSIKNIGSKSSVSEKSAITDEKTENSEVRQDKTDNFTIVQRKNDDYTITTQSKNKNYQLISLELPIHYEGQKFSGKLYFIRRNYTDNKKNIKISNEPFTACLLLDFQNLGLVQTLVSLKQKSVHIHMKVENKHIAEFIHAYYSELYNGLKSKGYFLLNLKCDVLHTEIIKKDLEHSNKDTDQPNRILIEENIERDLYNYHTSIDYRV